MQKLVFLFFSLLSFSLFAQNKPANPLSVRSHGIANASIAFNDINSLFNNQAGLADLENIGLLFSSEESFRNPDSDSFGGGFAVPTSLGTFGMNIHYFDLNDGNIDINQTKVGLAYARKLMEELSVGVQFDLVNTQILMNERSNLFTFEIGLQYKVSENFIIGFHVFNPAKLEIVETEFLTTTIRLGGTYAIANKFLIHGELEKDFDFPLVLKSGIELELATDLWIRFGFKNKPTTLNMGMGYQLKNGLRLDLAAFYQQDLNLNSSGILGSSGLLPSIGLGFDFNKKTSTD